MRKKSKTKKPILKNYSPSTERQRLEVLTNKELERVLTSILDGTLLETKDVQGDPDATVLKKWIASIVQKAIRRGDARTFALLMDRLVGRPKVQVEHSGQVSLAALLSTYAQRGDEAVDAPVIDASVVDAPVIDAPVIDASVVDALPARVTHGAFTPPIDPIDESVVTLDVLDLFGAESD